MFTSKLYLAKDRIYYIEKLIKRYTKIQEGHKTSTGFENQELKNLLLKLEGILEDMKRN